MLSQIDYNRSKELRMAYSKLRNQVIHNDGIVFGGMVRDEIIATYNKTKFEKYIKSDTDLYKRFWDRTFHPESINRMKVPNDIDVYFNKTENANKFVESVELMNKSFDGLLTISEAINPGTMHYTALSSCVLKKIKMELWLGKTLAFRGYKLEVNIDMIVNNDDEISHIFEPPFNSCDFTCNMFVMVKAASGYDIRLSKNTGTPVDSLDYVSKKRIETKIIDELLLGRVEFVRSVLSANAEYVNGFRIVKMIQKYEYEITNLLFRSVERTRVIEPTRCDICIVDIESAERENLIEILTNEHCTNIMHKRCFIDYLKNEISKKYVNPETRQIVCRCSRRNPFNFKDSYKNSIPFKEVMDSE